MKFRSFVSGALSLICMSLVGSLQEGARGLQLLLSIITT